MILISNPAEITTDFYCLGPPQIPVFLLDGDNPAIFDAGMTIGAEYYVKELNQRLQNKGLSYLFITHMHFDHCGSAAYLKKHFPTMKIAASAIGSEIIQKESAVKTIRKLNNMPGLSGKTEFEPFKVDVILEDGQSIKLNDDLTVQAFAVPGHTRDMMAYYIPEKKILLPSESVGVPQNNHYIFSEFLVNYSLYLESLKKLEKLDFNILVMAHGTVYTDEDATSFIPNAISQTMAFKDKIVSLLESYQGDEEKVAEEIKKEEYDPQPEPKQPFPAYKLNLMAKIKAVKKYIY